jgi:hypothetical protein
MAHNDAHNALVREALEALAIAGYTAWRNETGAWFDGVDRPHKYGKKGSGDIFIILPVAVTWRDQARVIGWHIEAEAKTGVGRQNKNQKDHQKFVVERNGGIYILFRAAPELLEALEYVKNGGTLKHE